MIDGKDAGTAGYWLAGIVGIPPHGMTVRELWSMACGRLYAIRLHVFWQTELIANALGGKGKFDVAAFIRCGAIGVAAETLTMSPELRRAVEEEQRKMNEGQVISGKPC